MLSTEDKDGIGRWLKRKREGMRCYNNGNGICPLQKPGLFHKVFESKWRSLHFFISPSHHLSHLPQASPLEALRFTSSLTGRPVSEGDPRCWQYRIVMYLYTFSFTSRGNQGRRKSSALLEWEGRCIHIDRHCPEQKGNKIFIVHLKFISHLEKNGYSGTI